MSRADEGAARSGPSEHDYNHEGMRVSRERAWRLSTSISVF
jgi:hypothetical protein